MTTVTVQVLIDHDDDGSLEGDLIARGLGASDVEAYEDVSAYVRHSKPVTVRVGRDSALELAPPAAGATDAQLDNRSGVFSAEDPDGPLYGYLGPGKPLHVRAHLNGVEYAQFRGRLDEPVEEPLQSQQLVTMRALDGLAELRATKVSTARYTTIRTDEAIGHVLDAAGWPADRRVLSVGQTTIAAWWVDGVLAFDAIRDLVFAEGPGAIVYVDGDGNLVFEDRHYRLVTARCLTSQATFRPSGAEPRYTGYQLVSSLKNVINAAAIPLRSFATAALGVIWTGPTPLTLQADEALPLVVSTTADGFTGALAPVAGTDYTVTAGSIVSAVLSRPSGKTATLTLTAGASGATVTGVQVRAEAITIKEQGVPATVDASESRDIYGVRSLPSALTPKWITDLDLAYGLANHIVARYRVKVPQLTLTVISQTDERAEQILGRRVSDRITVVDPRTGAEDDYVIEAIERRFSYGRNAEATFLCERADAQAVWILGDLTLSLLGVTTRLS